MNRLRLWAFFALQACGGDGGGAETAGTVADGAVVERDARAPSRPDATVRPPLADASVPTPPLDAGESDPPPDAALDLGPSAEDGAATAPDAAQDSGSAPMGDGGLADAGAGPADAGVDPADGAPPPECVEGARDVVPCGLNGRGGRERRCVGGVFVERRDCVDPDGCVDGGSELEGCDDGGQRERKCAAGQFGPWGPCEVADDCGPVERTVIVGGDFVSDVFDVQLAGESAQATLCGRGGHGPEARINLEVLEPIALTIRSDGNGDPILDLRAACGERSFACNDGVFPGDPRTQLHEVLQPGLYILFVDTDEADFEGAIGLEFTTEAEPCEFNTQEWEPCEHGAVRIRTCNGPVFSAWSECQGGCPPDDAECALCVDALEPNGVPALAAALPLDVVVEGLSLCPGVDNLDYYTLHLDTPGWLTVTYLPTADSPGRNGWQAGLEGDPGALGALSGSSTGRSGFMVGVVVGRPGEVRTRILAVQLEARLDYSVVATLTPTRACELNPGPDCFQCLDANEPNDTFDVAQPLPVGVEATGAVCAATDPFDYYVVDLPEPATVHATLRFRDRLGNGSLWARDAAGMFIRFEIEDLLADGAGFVYRAERPAGEFFVGVDGNSGVFGYTLTVTAD